MADNNQTRLPTDFKPVACKGNCGKDIVFERMSDGKWLVSEFDTENWVKLEKHNCPNYAPKPKAFEQRGQGTNWAGTNKQGQMFEARVAQDVTRAEGVMNELIAKMLTDISRELKEQKENIFKLFDNQLVQGQNIIEILGLLQKPEEPKTAAEEAVDNEDPAGDQEVKEEYGF